MHPLLLALLFLEIPPLYLARYNLESSQDLLFVEWNFALLNLVESRKLCSDCWNDTEEISPFEKKDECFASNLSGADAPKADRSALWSPNLQICFFSSYHSLLHHESANQSKGTNRFGLYSRRRCTLHSKSGEELCNNRGGSRSEGECSQVSGFLFIFY